MENKITAFNRFSQIWLPDFFKEVLLKEKSSASTWKFWFLWSTLFTVVATIIFSLGTFSAQKEFEETFLPTLDDFEIELKNNQLSTTFSEPVLWEDDELAVILDTQKIQYDETVLQNYKEGFFITENKILIKDGNSGTYETVFFEAFETDFTLSKVGLQEWFDTYRQTIKWAAVGVFFFGIGLSLHIYCLLTAFFWGGVFWGVGKMVDIKHFSFWMSYRAVLNLYFIPLLFESLLFINGAHIPFFTPLLFCLLFGMNFWILKEPTHEHAGKK